MSRHPHHHHHGVLLLPLLFLMMITNLQLLPTDHIIMAVAEDDDLSSDRQALLDFAAAVPHPRTRKLNWVTNSSLCDSWVGVTCNTDATRVIALRLPAAGFYGSIPPNTLGRLHALSSLSLRSNRLHGALPPDILSLPSIRYVYFQHNNFSGDVPSSLSPQLNFLDLSFNSFTGNIPSGLNNLTRLTALNLHNNSLTGPIPDLIRLSGLQQLNLSNNHLNGSIPPYLRRFPASSFQGNSFLCGRPLNQCPSVLSPSPSPSPAPAPLPAHSPTSFAHSPASATLPSSPAAASFRKSMAKAKTKLSTGSTVGIAVGTCVVLFLVVLVSRAMCCAKKREAASLVVGKGSFNRGGRIEKAKEEFGRVPEAENNKLVFLEGTSSPTFDNFDLEQLLGASAKILGKGSYGTTYKAAILLEEGTSTVVAVKRLKQVMVGKTKREFEQHMECVGRVNHHPNVVSLRAYYYSKDEKLLVYDFAPLGNLSTLLHGNRELGRTLDWESRIKLSLGAARGIAHIHSVAGGRLIHGNIKSSNVLLTRNLSGCISDFGITPLVGFYIMPCRNSGYQAPEVSESMIYTQKSDVYSFGVVLLEMLTGRAPARSPGVDDVIDLPRWVQSVVREGWTAKVFDIELMKYQNIEEEMVQMLQIALACVEKVPEARPKMDQVVQMIEEILQPDVENRLPYKD